MRLRSDHLVLSALVLIGLALRLAIVARPFPVFDNLWLLPDDAYISLGIARNIALGHGPLAGLAPTNGFQPLYVFLMVPAYWIWPTDLVTPIRTALVLLILFDAITLCLLFRWVRRLTGSTVIAMTVGLAWAVNVYVIRTTLNGLETAISMCFIVACFSEFSRLVEETWEMRRLKWLGVLLGFAILARADNGLLAFAIAGVLALRMRRDGASLGSIGKTLAELSIPAMLVNVPWWLYSIHHTGTIIPVSGEAVRFQTLSKVDFAPTFDNLYLPIAQQLRHSVAWNNRVVLVASGVLFAAGGLAFFLHPSAARTIRWPKWTIAGLVLHAVMLTAAYSLYFYGHWYFVRYLAPLLVLFLVALALAMRFALDAYGDGTARIAGVVTALGLTVVFATDPQFRRFFESGTAKSAGYMNIGLWAESHFPPGTRIGGAQTGALAYFAPDVVVINLDGVVNRECLDALEQHRAMDYVRRVGIQYVVNWPQHTEQLLAASTGASSDDLPLVTRITEFRSWNNSWLVFKVRY